MTLFDKIKETAYKKGLSLNELNDQAGFKPNIIYSWKHKNPTVNKLEEVANVLGVTVDYLLEKNETPDWATQNDTLDLKKFLEFNEGTCSYGGNPLTEEEKEKLKIALTQIFWDHQRQ